MAQPLPILLSVPHAGLQVPDWLASECILTPEEIVADGDVGAAEIYALQDCVAQFVTTDVARAIVDLNRAPDAFWKDGVVKTHTCWDVPVYRSALAPEQIERLLREHYHPYHEKLSALATGADRPKVGVDAHTMAAVAPPVAPDVGQRRPMVCIGDGDGACPREWAERLVECCARHFPGEITLNRPFGGGYITRHHGAEMPWVQVEMSRDPTLSTEEKRRMFLASLREWCSDL